ncbi:hypothetical protein Acr_00g0056560 [Actinidia rufa]|uniref:Uncharacterized protein n=1 Tax=Actinidia rufa TaxID=165716 RepID=A0A7J0DMI1_9ERIC|nr:hypothetical protein Acr_00g0056560 [Actinidia rufa]
MELNRAQLLVYDDRALEKFKATHGNPANVMIERLGPTIFPRGSGEIGLHPSSCLANLPGQAPISNQLDVERGDSVLPSHLYAGNPFYRSSLPMPKGSQSAAYEVGHWQPRQGICLLMNLSGFQAPRNSDLGMTAFGRSQGATEACLTFNDMFKICSDACKEAIRTTNNKQESRDVEAFNPEVSVCKEGYATSSSSCDSLDPVGGEEEEEEVARQPAWAKAALAPEFPESSAPYSPLILSALNLQATNLAKEVGRAVAKEFGERSAEETGADDGRDANQNSPS